MLTRSKFTAGLAAAGGALTLMFSLAAPPVDAGERTPRPAARNADQVAASGRSDRAERRRAPRGDSSRETEVKRTENGRESHTVVTGENGRSATRDATVTRDREARTRTRDVTYTGPNGGVRTVNDVATRTDTGHTRQTTVTDAQGRTATRDAVVTRDPEAGTRTRDVTYTGRNGGTATVDDVTQRTDSGYTRQTTVAGPNGGTATRDVTVACDETTQSCTRSVDVDREPPASDESTGGT